MNSKIRTKLIDYPLREPYSTHNGYHYSERCIKRPMSGNKSSPSKAPSKAPSTPDKQQQRPSSSGIGAGKESIVPKTAGSPSVTTHKTGLKGGGASSPTQKNNKGKGENKDHNSHALESLINNQNNDNNNKSDNQLESTNSNAKEAKEGSAPFIATTSSVGVGAIIGEQIGTAANTHNAAEYEEKGLFFHIKIRVFGYGFDPSYSHGYCVDDTPAGISHPVGELYIDIKTVTLKQLRPIIQYNRTGHMDRRSMMFQEALFIMERLVNKYGRPKSDLKKYQFGWINRGNFQVCQLNSPYLMLLFVMLCWFDF
jgi:hypothetical protein